MASYANVSEAARYARDVVNGKIIACRYVRLACQRHLDDLVRSKDKDYPYRFDKAKAERVCRFIQLLPHTKGRQFIGKALSLEPWQKFILTTVFGWVYKHSGLRRFTEVYEEVARKNGKSAKTAGVGHYLFCADGEYGAEVYCGATTEKQAMEVFTPAKRMAKLTPTLRKRFAIELWAKKLTRIDGSKFEPLIGDPGDGASPSAALVDEYHEHPDASLYDTMLTGMGAREQGLMWVITTAGYRIDGPCFDLHLRVVEMLEGEVDDHLFGIIFTIDEADDWTSDIALLKANPNAGVSVRLDYLRQQQQRAIKRARYVNSFKTKHLNIWVAGKEAFFNMETWQACKDEQLRPEQFIHDKCFLAFDLARKLDMNSIARLYSREIEGKRHYYSVGPLFYVPEEQIFDNDDKRLAEKFGAWASSGEIIATEGAEIDYRAILEDAKEINLATPVIECALDPSGAIALGHSLDDEGLNPITITQNFTNMSDPMKELEAAILTGRFHHDGHPIMTWCIGNVVGKHLPGNDDVVRPIKQKANQKIDGAVTLIMAIGRAMLQNQYSSVYESEGILFL